MYGSDRSTEAAVLFAVCTDVAQLGLRSDETAIPVVSALASNLA